MSWENRFCAQVREERQSWEPLHESIQDALRSLGQGRDFPSGLDNDIQRLESMTLDRLQGSDDPTVAGVRRKMCAAKGALEQLLCPAATKEEDNHGSAGAQDHEEAKTRVLQQAHALDLEAEAEYESKLSAELDLEEFERELFAQWRERKRAVERCTLKHAVLTGMQQVLRATLVHFDERTSASGGSGGNAPGCNSGDSHVVPEPRKNDVPQEEEDPGGFPDLR
mmetsp:Transcript_51750/g.120262  ORF Transcript_51750/g.120262 Transcript_51750/m.120262 type:complete len:224 (+) Transcript_51750:104-775(+)